MLTQQKAHQMKLIKKVWEETKPALVPLQLFFGFALAIYLFYIVTVFIWQIGI